MFKGIGPNLSWRRLNALGIMVTIIIGSSFLGSNYPDLRSIRAIQTDAISYVTPSIEMNNNHTQNASLTFIPTNIILNHKFPIRISNPVNLPLFYNASWESSLVEINNTLWIELDGSANGIGSIQFYQVVNGELIEFSISYTIIWSIPEITSELPVKINYDRSAQNSYLWIYDYTLKAQITTGSADIQYTTANEDGPIAANFFVDGVAFPSFSDLLEGINLTEVRRFQTWIIQSDIMAYDGGTETFGISLGWEDGSSTFFDYHTKLEGQAIFTIQSHGAIRDLERIIYYSIIDSMNNSINMSSTTENTSIGQSLFWMTSSFGIGGVALMRRRNHAGRVDHSIKR